MKESGYKRHGFRKLAIVVGVLAFLLQPLAGFGANEPTPTVKITTVLPVDATADSDKAYMCLSGTNSIIKSVFELDIKDKPKKRTECILTGPIYKWTISPANEAVKLSPTADSTTTLSVSNVVSACGDYNLEVKVTWLEEAEDGKMPPESPRGVITCEDDLVIATIKVDFVQMCETRNRANKIFNATRKDDPIANEPPDDNGDTYGVPRDTLYMVPSAIGDTYNVTLCVDIQPADLRTRCYAAGCVNNKIVSGSGRMSFNSEGKCEVNFLHPGPSPDIEDFTIRVGFDVNGNKELDQEELFAPIIVRNSTATQAFGEPTIRGSSNASYNNCLNWLALGGLSGSIYHNGADFLKVFIDGNSDDVSEDNTPTLSFDSFNCFLGPYCEWLTHNSGAEFNENGTVPNLPHCTWRPVSRISQDIADSAMLKNVAQTYYNSTVIQQVEAFFAANQTINEYDFDVAVPHASLSPTNWVPPATVSFHTGGLVPDDLGVTVGRGRVAQHRADYFVKRSTDMLGRPVLIVTAWRSYGTVEDLYDFNHNQSDGLGLGQKGAVVQIGHGNGNGRAAGFIYRVTINFDKAYGGF